MPRNRVEPSGESAREESESAKVNLEIDSQYSPERAQASVKSAIAEAEKGGRGAWELCMQKLSGIKKIYPDLQINLSDKNKEAILKEFDYIKERDEDLDKIAHDNYLKYKVSHPNELLPPCLDAGDSCETIDFVAGLKGACPEININISEKDKQLFVDRFHNYYDYEQRNRVDNETGEHTPAWNIILSRAIDLKIIDSKLDPGLTDNDWDEIKQELEEIKKKSRERHDEEKPENDWKAYYWREFAQLASLSKILNPALDIGIDEEAVNGIEHARKKRDSYGFMTCRKVLAAEKVEVTDKGLEITMPEKK